MALTYGHATLQKDGLSLLKDAFDPIIDSYSHYIARNNFHMVFQNPFTQMFLYHHPNFVSKPEDFNDLLHPRRGDVGDSITLDYSDLNIFFMHYIKNMDTFLKVCALGGGFSEYLRLRLFNAEKIVSLNNPEVLWTSSHYDLSIKMISDYIIAGNLLSFFVKTPLDLMRFFEKIEFSERHDNSWKHQIKLSDLNEAWITKNSAAFDNLKGSSRSNANFFFKTLICAVHAAQHIYPLH